MPTNEFKQEQLQLQKIYNELDQQLHKSTHRAAIYREELRSLRSSLWEEGINSASSNQLLDIAQQIAELQQRGSQFGIQHRSVEQLQAMEKSPYFGRMDFHEDGLPQVEAMYIGIRSLIDQANGRPLIYDWRAPVSSMFYDFGLGKAKYSGPAGVFSGEISLKRQYRIENRQLLYMFDNELKIDDQVLQEALSTSVSESMRTIVNTIQKEQNQAIRNENDSLLLVEGPAGSGKTSVALHRIAFLLYRYREAISSENIVIFSPNRIFSDYISHVLPELGEENVRQTTFQDYAESFLDWNWEPEAMMDFLEYFLHTDPQSRDQRLQLVAFKASHDLQAILANLVSYIQDEITFSTLKFREKTLITQEQQEYMFLKNYAYLPLNKRLAKIQQRIAFLVRPLKKELQRQILQELASSDDFSGESWLTMAREAITRSKQELQPLQLQLEQSLNVDALAWYKKLWSDDSLWKNIAAGRACPPNGKNSLATLQKGFIAFEDLAPLLYLQGELNGYPVQREIRHVVVDEVQDYSPLQLQILRETFPRAKFTLVGDLQQSLNPSIWQENQASLQSIFADLEPTTVQLTKSYRSTEQIFDFCTAIFQNTAPVETVIRKGAKPELSKVTKQQQTSILVQQISKYAQKGHKTIAVICLDLAQSKAVFKQLQEANHELELSLLDHEKAKFKPGVVVLPVYLAKGLEFDAVILPEVNQETYGQSYHQRLLYVACSRALHDLCLIYTDELSPFIKQIPQDLSF